MKGLASISLALLAAGCLGKADTRQVDLASQRFFQLLAARQYGEIYAETAPEFRRAAPEQTFTGFMQRIDRKLGVCQPPVKTPDWRINATTNGTTVVQGYSSDCANGRLQQALTVLIRGGKAQVLGYNANSPLLLTD